MSIKLGDLVVRKGEKQALLFQVTGFDEEFAVLKGVKIPIITIYPQEDLIKINRTRKKLTALKRVK